MSVPLAWRSCFSEDTETPRAAGSRAFARLVELVAATPAEVAETMARMTGYPVTAELVEAWCDPTGPLPPVHWLVALAQRVGPAAGPVLAELAG